MNVDMAVWPCTLTVEVPSCMCDDILLCFQFVSKMNLLEI